MRVRPALLLVIALVLIAALPILTYPLGRDQGEFAVIGRGLLEGRAPYIDLWNPKPPAVFAVYAGAIAVFGGSVAGLRALDLILFILIAPPLTGLARRMAGDRAALLAIALFALAYFTESFWTLTQNDGIAMLPMVWAVYAAVRAGEARGAAWAFACGALLGVSVWFKYPFALMLIPVIAAWWVARGHVTLRTAIAPALAAGTGGVIIIALGAGWLMALGAWDAFIESALVTGQYTALGVTEAGNLFAEGISTRLAHWAGLWLLTGAACIAAFRRGGSALTRVVVLWLVCGLAIMVVQLKGYDYHWLPALPPLVLSAAYALDKGIALVGRAARPLGLAVVGGAIGLLALHAWGGALPYLRGQIDERAYAARFVAGDFHADESLAVAALLRERVTSGDSLFIWGFRPEVYFLADLRPATRFIFNFPLVAPWYPPGWRDEAVAVLWAALPPYVLVLEADYLPWVTGSDEDSHTLLLGYTELRNWLEYNYTRETEKTGSFLLWRRTTPPP
jgi:hypothetical protein